MKLNAAKIKECADWVEKHGLHPQACGASVQDFCRACGISDETYSRWCKRSVEFVEALARAREIYAAKTVRDVENALVKAAVGVDYEKVKQEGKQVPRVIKTYDPVTGKLIREETVYEMVTTKAVRERVYFPPDVRAAQFVLTNMAGDRWKNKESKDVKVDGKVTGLQIEVTDDETREALEKVAGTEPAK